MRKLMALVVLATLLHSRPARADDAEALYESAWQAMDRKDYEAACQLFDKSYAASRATGPLQGLAQCFEARGLLKQSLDFWRDAERQLPADSPSRGEVSAAVSRLQVEVPLVSFRLPDSAPSNVRIELDGKLVTLDSGAIEIDPAVQHEAVVRAPGYTASRTSFRLAARERRTVVLAVGASEARESASAVGPVRGIGIGLTALGGVGLLTAAITSGVMASQANDIEDGCPGPENTDCNLAALAASEDAKALAPWNAAAWVIGVAALGAGVPMIIVGDSEQPVVTVGLRGPLVTLETSF